MGYHSVETVEFRYGFKLLWLAFGFQTLAVSVTVSHFFQCRYRVNAILKRRNFVIFGSASIL